MKMELRECEFDPGEWFIEWKLVATKCGKWLGQLRDWWGNSVMKLVEMQLGFSGREMLDGFDFFYGMTGSFMWTANCFWFPVTSISC